MSNEAFKTMFVPADLAELGRYIAAGLSPRGAGMFETGVSSTGLFPATYYVSSGFIDAAIGALLANGALLYGACQQAGLTVTLDQCEDLVARCDVSEDNPHSAFDRLGLALCQPPAD